MARVRGLFAIVASLPLSQTTSFLPFLDFTSPSPYIFHTVATLLQVRPQTLFPDGHTIASVTIPRHTLLYHGRHDNDPVPSPEWLAFDVDMAYWIMGNMQDSRMLTYRTTRDVKAVHFDGTSASLIGEGTLSQMVFLYNGTDGVPKRGGWGPPPGRGPGHGDHRRPPSRQGAEDEENPPRRPPGGGPPHHWNPLQDEYFRARGLCQWLSDSGLAGPGWGYEGIVRMNAGFEMIWCDFESPSVKLVSNLNVSAPLSQGSTKIFDAQEQLSIFEGQSFKEAQARLSITEDEGPHGPPMTDVREPFRNSSGFFWFSATAKRYTGDARIRADPSGLFSFYEPGLQNQTLTRVADEIVRLGLGENGEWKGRRSSSLAKGSEICAEEIEKTKRDEELHSLMARRRRHRLTTVDKNDGAFMRDAVEKRLHRSLEDGNSDRKTDWHFIAKEVITRYSEEISTLLYHLRRVRRPDETHRFFEDWISQIRQVTHWFMLPFLEYPPDRPYAKEDLQDLFSLDSSLAHQALERCIAQYNTDDESVNEEDTIFSEAVRETLHALCSTVIRTSLEVEYTWFKYFDFEPDRTTPSNILRYAKVWTEDVEELIAWLGWAEQSTHCKKTCGPGEICYLPMWPVGGQSMRPPRREMDPEFLWEPVCVGIEKYPPEQWRDEGRDGAR